MGHWQQPNLQMNMDVDAYLIKDQKNYHIPGCDEYDTDIM